MVYVTIAEAADRLGVSEDTIRRRRKAGEIPAQQEQTPSGFRWLVEIPEDAQAETPDAGAAATSHASVDALELATLRAEVAGLERLLSEVAADRDHWRETAQHAQGLARVNAETAQSLALPSGATGPGTTSNHAGAGTPTSPGARESLRERILRLWRGG